MRVISSHVARGRRGNQEENLAQTAETTPQPNFSDSIGRIYTDMEAG